MLHTIIVVHLTKDGLYIRRNSKNLYEYNTVMVKGGYDFYNGIKTLIHVTNFKLIKLFVLHSEYTSFYIAFGVRTRFSLFFSSLLRREKENKHIIPFNDIETCNNFANKEELLSILRNFTDNKFKEITDR